MIDAPRYVVLLDEMTRQAGVSHDAASHRQLVAQLDPTLAEQVQSVAQRAKVAIEACHAKGDSGKPDISVDSHPQTSGIEVALALTKTCNRWASNSIEGNGRACNSLCTATLS